MGYITCQPLTALDDTQEATWRLWSTLLLCKVDTSRVRQFYMGQKRVLSVGVSDQAADAEARTGGPHCNRLSFLPHKKHPCFIPGQTQPSYVSTHSPCAGNVLNGPLGALALRPGHQPLPGDGPVVAFRGVQSFFYSNIHVFSGDEGFCVLLLGERRPAEWEPPAHTSLLKPAGLQPTDREAPPGGMLAAQAL